MKIILFSHLFPFKNNKYHGVFNYSRALALKKRNCEVKVISPNCLTPPLKYIFPRPDVRKIIKYIKKGVQINKREYYAGIEVCRPLWFSLPKKYFWHKEVDCLNLFAGRFIKEEMIKFAPDLILSTWINPEGAFSSIIKKSLNIPYFTIADGSDVLVFPHKYKGWRTIEDQINKNSDSVILASESMKETLSGITKLKKMKVIHNGYNDELFYYESSRKIKKCDIPKLFSLGALERIKGHDILIDAVKRLNSPVELTILGRGSLLHKYQDILIRESLLDKIKIISNMATEELRQQYHACNLFCMPSRSEGLPAAPLEAMACGLPVIASRVGGMTEIVIDGFNGYLVNPDDPREYAEKIEKALNHDWNSEEIAQWVRKKFSWDIWAQKMLDLYNEQTSQV